MKRFAICHWSLLILLGCACLLSSCRKGVVFSQFVPISSEGWEHNTLPEFVYTITDAEAAYRMLIYVRHTERYPYQNMWLFVRDNQGHRDTIEFYLADDRGQWLGDKHHGFIEMPVLLEENYHFPDTGCYRIAIQHGMRDSVLRGVTDIGLEIYGQK